MFGLDYFHTIFCVPIIKLVVLNGCVYIIYKYTEG